MGALDSLKAAVNYFRSTVAADGGYVYDYLADLSQRWGEVEATATEIWIESPGTPAVGWAMLRAYERTGDTDCLAGAAEVAAALVSTQHVSGGWHYKAETDPTIRASTYIYQADGTPVYDGRNNWTALDDDQTQGALRFLIRYDRATGFTDTNVHACVIRALASILSAQYPNGGWPARYRSWEQLGQTLPGGIAGGYVPAWAGKYETPVAASAPASWPLTQPVGLEYLHFCTMNDAVIPDTIRTLLLAYEVYGTTAYLTAAELGGTFLINASMPAPSPGWAQQYDEDMHPWWGRTFEPPALASMETIYALRALLQLYFVTGDAAYAAPVPGALAWMNAVTLGAGVWSRFYEMGTDTPVYVDSTLTMTYSDLDLLPGYSWKPNLATTVTRITDFYNDRAVYRAQYVAAIAAGMDLGFDYIEQIIPVTLRPARPSGATVAATIAAMDGGVRWLDTGHILTTDFNDNVDILSLSLEVGVEWFVKQGAAAGGLGTAGSPFDTIADALAAWTDGDIIYLAGDGEHIDLGGGSIWAKNPFRETVTLNTAGKANGSFLQWPGEDPAFVSACDDKGPDSGAAWAGPDGNGEYTLALASDPVMVYRDGVLLVKGTVGSLAANQWGYSGGTIYAKEKPDSALVCSRFDVGVRTSYLLKGSNWTSGVSESATGDPITWIGGRSYGFSFTAGDADVTLGGNHEHLRTAEAHIISGMTAGTFTISGDVRGQVYNYQQSGGAIVISGTVYGLPRTIYNRSQSGGTFTNYSDISGVGAQIRSRDQSGGTFTNYGDLSGCSTYPISNETPSGGTLYNYGLVSGNSLGVRDNAATGGAIVLRQCHVTGNGSSGGSQTVFDGVFGATADATIEAAIYSAGVAGHYAILASGNLTGVKVHRSTIYGLLGGGLNITSATATGWEIVGSILVGLGSPAFQMANGAESGALIAYNCFWAANAGDTIAVFKGVTYTRADYVAFFAALEAENPLSVGNICADPKFVDAARRDFHLALNSPCSMSGTAISGVTEDYEGTPINGIGGYSMGAYEGIKTQPIGVIGYCLRLRG